MWQQGARQGARRWFAGEQVEGRARAGRSNRIDNIESLKSESLKTTNPACTLSHATTMLGECVFFTVAYWFLWTVVGDSTRECASPGRDE